MIVGNVFKALANPYIAKAFFPLTLLAKSSTAIAIYNSEFPPPKIMFLS
jgi:hypothetical protein